MTAPFPLPCLLADIGGTNARVALIEARDGRPTAAVRLQTGAYEDAGDMIAAVVGSSGWPQPLSMLIAAAGPVDGLSVTLTNAATAGGRLMIDGPALARRFALRAGLLLNDFEALALSVPFLRDDEVMTVRDGAADGGPRLIVGPGTGLGVAALLSVGGRWLPLSSEAGHTDFGPGTEAERAIWPYVGLDRATAEDAISGRGLARLHAALTAARGRPAARDPADVTAAALAGPGDARDAALLLLGLLGRFAADMALAFRATGGVWIGGGVAQRLAPLIPASALAAPFAAEGAMADLLRRMPVRLIRQDDAALAGLAALAADPSAFHIDCAARGWR